MKMLFHILTVLVVIALAFWAYRENYATQAALKENRRVQGEIRAAHARLTVLRAEWAYLNRPSRLRDLADLNFERLGLLHMRPGQFGQVAYVTYPAPEPALFDLDAPVDVAAGEVRP